MDTITIEKIFTGKSGATIVITRYGENDYSAWWTDEDHLNDETFGYSVRGSLNDVVAELKDEQ